MITHKRYKFCPECQSVMIQRVHRGFIQKYIFRQKPKYNCNNCQTVFFTPLFEKDIKKLQTEECEVTFEEKPTLSLEEVHEINVKQNDESIIVSIEEDKDEKIKSSEKDFHAVFQKGI